ncbi:CDC42 small effector protein 2 [Aphelenchoides avenae]|nr:CDC42 small effector protein 2 [Aphelenchus avenae]
MGGLFWKCDAHFGEPSIKIGSGDRRRVQRAHFLLAAIGGFTTAELGGLQTIRERLSWIRRRSVMIFNRRHPRFWVLSCCVSPQSDIGRVRIDRSMIGVPSDFRHIGHLGADDLTSSCNADTMTCLLSSKGGDEFSMPVPANARAHDVPIKVSE